MEALLIDEWLRDSDDAIFVYDEASLTSVRDRIRQVAADGGVPSAVVDRAVLVASELGRNHLRHALAGRILVLPLVRGEHRGLEIVAVDRGTGLADPAGALDPRPRTEGTLGVGVGSVRRLSSEVDFDVRLGEGTSSRASWTRTLRDGARSASTVGRSPRRRSTAITRASSGSTMR